MFKSIRFNVVLYLFMVMTLLLAACSGGTQESGATPSPSPAVQQDATGAGQESAAPESDANDKVEQIELTISAAASLTDALQEIGVLYESQQPGVKLLYNFGASGALQSQIEEGAPVDLFLSAASRNMNTLVEKGFIQEEDQSNLLLNELVVVVPADASSTIASEQDLTDSDVKFVAIGIPESVPAGVYAQEALEAAGLWEELQPKLVQGKDVRQVLQYVETGNADAGFVYKTDALSSEQSQIAFAVNPDSYSPVLYPAGIIKETKYPEQAAQFYEFLQSEEALNIFKTYGFSEAGK